MTFKPFKLSVLLLLITSGIWAQKVEKKFNEKFYTNKDVTIDINASNAEIEVTTWNKNEVSVEAVIEIEGLDKEKAQQYLDNWKFEVLGNKSKVEVRADKGRFKSFGKDNFIVFNEGEHVFPQGADIIEIPEINFGEIMSSEMMENLIVVPEINFGEIIIPEIEELEFDFDKYAIDGNTYFFDWKDGVNDVKIRSKKEWEEFKKSKKYKKLKKEQEKIKKELKAKSKELSKVREKQRKAMKEHKKELLKANREQKKALIEQRKAFVEARKVIEKINSKERRESIEKARLVSKNGNSFVYSFPPGDSNDLFVNGKKVKINKRIIIKVPKGATFDLNTRHCKVKLPKTKASGKVSYGSFKADAINGGKLNVSFSPVIINSLNTCSLFLNNVTDAQLASVTETIVESKSSDVLIENLYRNVQVSNSFGDLDIQKVHKGYNTFKVYLNYSNAIIGGAEIDGHIIYTNQEQSSFYPTRSSKEFTIENGDKKLNGNFNLTSKDNKIQIKGKYSQLKVKTM
ncbi:hypothetical protein SAMN04489761_0201 [Tenacibaculum sp. MAR_2009_124]|nr:hypothetical protein SAMN04489761_0201 [Tenacibaculum sp. MAR_2009_124]